MNRRKLALVAGSAMLCASCGGGGSSPAPTQPIVTLPPTPPAAPAPVNAAPVFSSAGTVMTPENRGPAFFVASASDPEGGALTFSISGGPDAAQFQISAGGALSFLTPPDFEAPGDADRNNIYAVDLRVSDGVNAASATLVVTVTNLGAPYVAPGVQWPDVTPTPAQPVAAVKLAADRWLVRTLSVEGGSLADFDEFELVNPMGTAGVADGWQVASHRAMVRLRYRDWWRPQGGEPLSTQEFAWRIGRINTPYLSGGDGPNFFYSGFGHGNMVYEATGRLGGSNILMDGSLPDYHGATPAGTAAYGASLTFLMNYGLRPGGGLEAARSVLVHTFAADGLTEYHDVQTSVAGFGVNDSTVAAYTFSGGDTIKPVGLAPVRLDRSGAQRGNWVSERIDEVQFYDSGDQTVMATMAFPYGQPLRRPDNSLAPYGLNRYLRFFVADTAGYGKFYALGQSSELELPRTSFPLTGTYEALNRIRTSIRNEGPQ